MNNKSIFLAGIFATILFVVAIGWWLLSPAWVLLFPHPISDQSQQNVLLLLNQKNIEYSIDSAKNTILVKSADLKAAQTMLAENGQPEEQKIGLEAFNSSDYGLSEFAQNINYQRGMEEELARTIRTLKGIKDARVHLTIKKESLFEERKQIPKASVVVTPYLNQTITAVQVVGIQEIVSAAVSNLEARQVVVITDAGVVLSSSDENLVQQGTDGVESKYSQRISHLLLAIMDESEFKVSVNVVVDKKKKVTVEESYFPDVNSGKGFLTKRKIAEKKQSASTYSDESDNSKSEEVEYLYSKERSEIVYPTGEILQITVGIVIAKPLSESEKTDISSLVFNSLGMSEARGDKVSLFSLEKNKRENNVVSKSDMSPVKLPSPVLPEQEGSIRTRIIENLDLIFMGFVACLVLSFIAFQVYLMRAKERVTDLSEAEMFKLSNDLKSWMKNT